MDGFNRLLSGISGVLRTHYPAFALGLPLGRNEIPIFIYHDVTPEAFAADLEFLRKNDYETLSLDEFMHRSRGGPARRGGITQHGDGAAQRSDGPTRRRGGRTQRRGVLITFDDARKSFYEAALPVLKANKAHATLFAPTHWMDAGTGSRAAEDDLFMTWPQLKTCVDSGWVDVQSHAHRHALVHLSGRLAGFAEPASLKRFDVYDWPMRDEGGGEALGRPLLGTPIYRAAPLLSARERYVENGEVRQACVDFVQARGGEAFFTGTDWRSTLSRFHAEAAARMPGRMLPASQFRALVASEFECSRDAFRRHLGYSPTYLAYPWMLGSRLSLELAKEFGIGTTFGVALDYGQARSGKLPLPTFGRLKCDWLHLLPGQGRSSFLGIAARKIAGFSKTLHLAH